jgi:hypothetical protein
VTPAGKLAFDAEVSQEVTQSHSKPTAVPLPTGAKTLVLGSKVSKAGYMNARAQKIAGMSAEEAVGTIVPNSKGGTSRYTKGDLKVSQLLQDRHPIIHHL